MPLAELFFNIQSYPGLKGKILGVVGYVLSATKTAAADP